MYYQQRTDEDPLSCDRQGEGGTAVSLLRTENQKRGSGADIECEYVGKLISWEINRLIRWYVDRLVRWYVDRLIGC